MGDRVQSVLLTDNGPESIRPIEGKQTISKIVTSYEKETKHYNGIAKYDMHSRIMNFIDDAYHEVAKYCTLSNESFEIDEHKRLLQKRILLSIQDTCNHFKQLKIVKTTSLLNYVKAVLTMIAMAFSKNSQEIVVVPGISDIRPHADKAGENDFPAKNMEGEGMQDTAQTTTFTNDAIVSVVEKAAPARFSDIISKASDQYNAMDIKSFMGKPILLQAGVFSVGDTFSTFTGSKLELPRQIVTNQLMSPKFQGFFGFRATMVFRWVINGNPFQQGRYLLCYCPLGGLNLGSQKAVQWEKLHTNSLTERTQLPHIELDVACDTEGIMRIPFDSNLNFFPLRGTSVGLWGGWGTLQVYPYSALLSPTGPTTTPYAIYASFEDIELVGAAVPQMGRDPIAVENKSRGQGPLSSVAFSFSKAAKALTPIPMISGMASTASWALDIIGNSAKAFGFSKPASESPGCRMLIAPAQYAGNVDGQDLSFMAAASSENRLSVIPGMFGTDVDQMDISYVAQIPAWYNTTSWGVGSPQATQIISFELRPSFFINYTNLGVFQFANLTPLAFCNNFFGYWRGSLRVKFKFVKTVYHSGRLSFSYSPLDTKVAAPPSPYLTNDYLHREIIDIRNCNEVEFTIPYQNMSPWCDVSNSIGYLNVHVVDPLVAPASVSQTIDIIAEWSGGPDIEFANPNSIYNNGALVPFGNAAMTATPHMGEDPCELVTKVIGSSEIQNTSPTIMSELCIGEKITSFRSLLKIFRPLMPLTSIPAAGVECIAPFAVGTWHYNPTGPVVTYPTWAPDMIDTLSPCYMYSRGGVRLKKQISTDANMCYYHVLNYNYGTTNPQTLTRRATMDMTNLTIDVRNLSGGKYVVSSGSKGNGFAEFSVPQYFTRYARNNAAELANPVTTYTLSPAISGGSGLTISSFVGPTPPSSGTPDFATLNFRAASEDFTLGNFVSTVPMLYYNNTGTVYT